MNETSATLLLPAYTLWRREVVRFYRQLNRVLGALATPFVFWLLIGSGLGQSFRPGGEAVAGGYLEYFFPGTVVLVVLFTSIFSTISIIEDRREGFLQGVLTAPVSRSAIVLGKVLGGTTLAMIQGIVFVALAPAAGIPLTPVGAAYAVVVLFVLSLALTGLGYCLAWKMDSTQGFHAIMNLILMPMWMLSGALFPDAGTPRWVSWLMAANPLRYGVDALRNGLYSSQLTVGGSATSLAATVAFAGCTFAAAVWMTSSRKSGDIA
jgi:ABC-2 type transport system permease protein